MYYQLGGFPNKIDVKGVKVYQWLDHKPLRLFREKIGETTNVTSEWFRFVYFTGLCCSG
jgi:hypothetical protein